MTPSETFANRTLAEELTGMYSQRVSGGLTQPKAPRRFRFDSLQNRNNRTVHPMHNRRDGAAPTRASF